MRGPIIFAGLEAFFVHEEVGRSANLARLPPSRIKKYANYRLFERFLVFRQFVCSRFWASGHPLILL